MQLYSLNTNNVTPLSSNYSYDNKVDFLKNTFYTENNIFLNLEKILESPNDSTINNYSNLHLTSSKTLPSVLKLKPLNYLDDEGFSTYLAANALYEINNETKFWVAEEPGILINTAQIAVSGIQSKMDNRYYFEITFLDDFKCKISHENDGIKRYLTVDVSGNLSFNPDANLDLLGEYSPQIFLYLYDRPNDLIAFFKNINDIIYYLGYDSINEELSFIAPITGSNINFSAQTVFRCQPRQDTSNITVLDDPWVNYQKSANNTILIDDSTSYQNVESNIMLNSQYYNISSRSLDVNTLSLKNTNTPENYQSKSNPFFQEQNVFMRDYKKLITGSNQELGNDNIALNYESYTSNVVFKKDKVTYFHVPQNLYPLTQLNINDSKLAEAGAIAGDHPMKSDKIFKKKADYKFTSFFGNSRLENNGSFLCSWLSGNNNQSTRPVWVDRYYFPSKVSFLGALTASNFNAIEYIPYYDCLRGVIPENVQVMDKLSDSIFEPGTYFAYYHIGEEYSKNYIKYLNKYLVQQNFSLYLDTNDAYVNQDYQEPVYYLNGNTYCITDNLSSIQNTNKFTIIFDAYSNDWTQPFGYQLIGNYSSDGFGVFNTNKVTPALFLNGVSSIEVTNLNFDKLNTIEVASSAAAIIRLDGFDDFYILTNDGHFEKYNNRYSKMYSVYEESFTKLLDFDYNNTYCFILGQDVNTLESRLFRIRLSDGAIEEIIQGLTSYDLYFYNVPLSLLVNAKTVNFKNNSFYFTTGDKAERYLDKIYFKKSSGINYAIYKWNIEYNATDAGSVNLILSAYNSLEDFDLDIDGNLWTLFDFNKYIVIDNNQMTTLSGILPLTACTSTTIDFGYNIEPEGLGKYTFISVLSANNKSIYYKFDNRGNLLETYYSKQTGYSNTSLTQSSFLRYYFSDLYYGNVLNVKLKLRDYLNSSYSDNVNINFNYGLSALTPGYHNFCFRFNSNGGTFHLIIDGKIVAEQLFTPKKYRFSNLIDRPFFLGTAAYSNSIPLFEYLKDNSLNCTGITVKNFYLYDQALNYFDILFHNRVNQTVSDIVFDLPCGRRNYMEEIERYFKFRTPGNKSTLFNIVFKNSGINNTLLRNEIEKRVYSLLAKSAPAYTKVKNIKWSE